MTIKEKKETTVKNEMYTIIRDTNDSGVVVSMMFVILRVSRKKSFVYITVTCVKGVERYDFCILYNLINIL